MKKSRIDEEPRGGEEQRKKKDLTTTKEHQKRKKKTQQQLTYSKERISLIRMKNGLRTMNIASLNPGSMKEEQMQREIIKNLMRNKIHIAAIQETHIAQDRDYLLDNNRIITASSTKSGKTGRYKEEQA